MSSKRDTAGQPMQWRDMSSMQRELSWNNMRVGKDKARKVVILG